MSDNPTYYNLNRGGDTMSLTRRDYKKQLQRLKCYKRRKKIAVIIDAITAIINVINALKYIIDLVTWLINHLH